MNATDASRSESETRVTEVGNSLESAVCALYWLSAAVPESSDDAR